MSSAPTQNVQGAFPHEMAFQRTWRGYQQRLLDKLDSYLDDGHVHIVAAPGSGKTVFGIEVVRRINKPTLVLAPTITIRNQWADRLVEHFLPPATAKPEWISMDLRQPALLTISTYQALHALCAGEMDAGEAASGDAAEEESDAAHANGDENGESKPRDLPEQLASFKTLVVDEAHHLRTEWWKTLFFVKDRLSPTTVALTATPPYDVAPYEWQRYEQLCGPIDAEVAVPELVLQGDLCPHQDYVYFSTPAPRELESLEQFRKAVDDFVSRLKVNERFATAVRIHPWLTKTADRTEQILEKPEYLSSMIVYLRAVGEDIPPEALRVLGISSERIPALELQWLEILLTNCLYTDQESFTSIEAILRAYRSELLRIGAIERRRVMLRDSSDKTKLLTTSITKLQSIKEIVQLEADAQSESLRCVVLTDFIRKSEMARSAGDAPVFEDIGVVPIFETLRRAELQHLRLGVLTGSLVIVPVATQALVQSVATEIGIRAEDLAFRPLTQDANYSSLELTGSYEHGMVRLMTSVFERGGITVLVGTKSLLGEGWDAPTINTLILATFVGSYMLSNQMRGRSIRIDPNCPNKTANIWHLVCVEPGLCGPGPDFELLSRRCMAFAGVSTTAPVIENGTERLGFGRPPFSREQISQLNERTRHRALDRGALRRNWDEALAAGSLKEMTYGVKTEEQALPRGYLLTNTLASLLVEAGAMALFLLSYYGRTLPRLHSAREYLGYALFVLFMIALSCGAWVLTALWRFLWHGTPERSMKQVGRAILEALQYEGSIESEEGRFRIYSDRNNKDGTVYNWLGGGTAREQTIYLRALRQVLAPVDNPRYILARKKLWGIFGEDYFSVPDVLARKKEFAEFLAKRWRRQVCSVELIYTRTPAGRATLLRARTSSLSASFQKGSERVSCWK